MQFWDPDTPFECTGTNVDTSDRLLSRAIPVATAYSVNNFDPPRIQSPLDSQPQPRKRGQQKQQGKDKLVEEEETPVADLRDANIGQTIPAEKEKVLDLLKQYIDIFGVNSKVVDACEGPPTILELKDPKPSPYVAHPRSYIPEQRQMIQEEVSKLSKAGAIRPSHSAYASVCHTVRKKDGTVRVVQDFRGLNALLKGQSGELGNLPTIFDEMGGSNCFTCLDIASGFLQLMIRESDRHLTAFREAEGKLWEFVRCGFRLKTVPSAFANYVGGQLTPVKMKGVRNWLNDIIIPTASLEDQFSLVREVFDLIRAGRLSVNLQKSEF